MKKNYLVQPEMCIDRKADYRTQKSINNAFETVDKVEGGTNGNIGSDIHIKIKTMKAVVTERPNMFGEREKYKNFEKDFCSFYEVISSALALYRLICIFPNPKFNCMDGANGYKMPWEIMLRHKKTNELIGFGEWKGGFNIRGTKNINEYDPKTIKDFVKLINLILSNKSPHPYDNVTAGGVA